MNQKDVIITAAGSIIVALVGWLSTTVIELGNKNIRLESEVSDLRHDLEFVTQQINSYDVKSIYDLPGIDDLIDAAHTHSGKGIKLKTYKKHIDK